MIGIWSAQAAGFLQAVSIGALLLVGLPMLFVPLSWARWLRWRIPEDPHLAIYFGRCLGAVASVLAGGSLWSATWQPLYLQVFFALSASAFALMVLVHTWGAWRRIQPVTESWETLAWLALLVLALLFWPGQ